MSENDDEVYALQDENLDLQLRLSRIKRRLLDALLMDDVKLGMHEVEVVVSDELSDS